MAIKNKIDIKKGDERYMDTREIKASPTGVKIRLYGEQQMGYSYFQKQDDDTVKVVRSLDFPDMENPTEGYQGAEQKPAVCLYSIAWDYDANLPKLLTLDKSSIINNITEVDENDDLKSITDYDFRISFDNTKAPADKYQVVRLDATDLDKEQKSALQAFAKTCDIESYVNGGEAFTSQDNDF